MKKKPIILIAFLLVLFIVPMMPVSAVYGDVSPQSVLGFSETLDDDVLFYPDTFPLDETTAYFGSNSEYWRLNDTDGTYWDSLGVNLEVYFDVAPLDDSLPVDGFDYFLYSGIPDGNLSVFNATSDAWDFIITLANGWNNGSVDASYLPDSPYGNPYITFLLSGAVYADYLGVAMKGMLLSDGTYAESFADVGDWAGWVGSSISTDGDIITGENSASSGTLFGGYYTFAVPRSWAGCYLEGRLSLNSTTNINSAQIALYNAAFGGIGAIAFSASTSWQTCKAYISVTQDTKYIGFSANVAGVANLSIYVDYLRISPANETGWQHDGSTTDGISSPDGGTIATDGDNITLTADGDGSTFLIVADTTSTASAISCTYYPFFSFDIESGSGNWALEQYDGSAYATLQSATAISAGTKRFNMRALDTYVEWWRVTLTASSSLVSGFAKAYSIAEFSAGSITFAGCESDDLLYVDESGVLQLVATGETDGSYYITCWTGTIFSTNTATFNVWNITTDSDRIDFYAYASGFTEYGYGITRGELASGTLTGIKILIADGDGSASVSAITFIDDHQWHEAGEAIIYFNVLFDYWAFDTFLIFFGLMLVVASGCYLAYCLKHTMTQDKGFYFLIAFMMGWGLFLGGMLI